MSKALRIWCGCLMGVFLVGASLLWFSSSAELAGAAGASVEVGGATYDFSNMNAKVTWDARYRQLLRERKVSSKASIPRKSLEELQNVDGGGQLSEVAELDNVRVVCDAKGMVAGLVDGVNVDDGVSDLERAAMLQNTWFLQNIMSCAKPGTAIFLPAGTYYFVSGHLKMSENSRWNERHVIQAQNNITLVGAGTDIDTGKSTTLLKPYSEESEFKDNIYAHKLNDCGPDGKNWKEHRYEDGGAEQFGQCWLDGDDWYGYGNIAAQTGKRQVAGGLDMFFRNDFAALDWPAKDSGADLYLQNANFYDFMVDSEKTTGYLYNTSGKGFMFNFFEDCVWGNVVVLNTDGTGFGVDNPINGKIINSLARGCGKGTEPSVGGGASGFGIGHGYSDTESMVIENSVAIENMNFGFFYEHQGRFNPTDYTAVRARAFTIKNCEGINNTYNFGGLRTNDVYYSGLKSVAGERTWVDIKFSDESRNTHVSDVEIANIPFRDVSPDAYYADAVKWGVANGVTNGVSSTSFGGNQAVRRADALVMMWRAAGRPGYVISNVNGNVGGSGNKNYANIPTCFSDVPNSANEREGEYYVPAVGWALEKGITTGMVACTSPTSNDGVFNPGREITRAEFVTMLWRMAGRPRASSSTPMFSDVTNKNEYYYDAVQWAASQGITNGVGDGKFAPNGTCTRAEVITMLYRYYNKDARITR